MALESNTTMQRSSGGVRSATWLLTLLLVTVHAASALAPTLPVDATIRRPITELPSAAPLLTTYWAVSASSSGLIASARYHGGTSLVNRSSSEFFFPTASNRTITSIVASKKDASMFAAIAVDVVYFFSSTQQSCQNIGSYTVLNQTFAMIYPTSFAVPLVVQDVLYIGTAKITGLSSDNAGVYALNLTSASLWWSFMMPSPSLPSSVQYANYQHFYDSTLRGVGALMLQTSNDGSSGTTTYFVSLAGVDLQAQIVSVDSPGYQLLVINSTAVMQGSFSLIFYLVPVFSTGTPIVANQTGKLGFSSDLSCALFQVITAPFYLYNGYVYASCISQFFVVNAYSLAFTFATPLTSATYAYGVAFTDTTDTVNRLFLGTAAGSVYRVSMTSVATLTLIYTDPDIALWNGASGEVGVQYLQGYYPVVSSAQLVPSKATPMLLVGTRVLDITSTVRAINPLPSSSVITWQIVLPNFRLTLAPAFDGLHCALASGTSSTGSSGDAPSIPLQLHSAYELIMSSNTTAASIVAPSPVFFEWPLPSPTPLGVAFDYEGQLTFIAAGDGLYQTTGGYTPSATRVCTATATSTFLITQPTWVYERLTSYKNVTYDVTTFFINTTNVTMHNSTSNTNYTVLVNVTMNTTTLQWRLDPQVNATKSLCYVDQQSRISCYNATTKSCGAINAVPLCDGSSSLIANKLIPVGGIGSGVVAFFCTGASATVGVNVLDVRSGVIKSFGSKTTSGLMGVVDDAEGAIYVPEELSGAAASAEPATKRYMIRKYWVNATTGASPVWSASSNVSIISNLAVDPVTNSSTTTFPRAVRVIGTVLPSNGIRGYQLASFAVSTGVSTSGASALLPVVQFDGAVESWLALSTRWVNVTTASSTSPLQIFAYVITNSFFAIVNVTGTGRTVPVVLWAPTTSFGTNIGLLNVRQATPIMDHNLGVAAVMGPLGVSAFSMRNGTFLWQSSFNTSYPSPPSTTNMLLTQINSTVVFSTQSGIAAVDMLTGTRTFDLSYQTIATAVGFNGTSARCAAVCGISTGLIADYTKNYFVAVVYTSEGLFGAPFYVQPNLTSQAMPLVNSSSGAFRPLNWRTETKTPIVSHTISWSSTQSASDVKSQSRTPSEESSLSGSDLLTLSVNPLASRTHKHTHSAVLTLSRTRSFSLSAQVSVSLSKPKKIPTRTRTTNSISMTHMNSFTSGMTITRRISATKQSPSLSVDDTSTKTNIQTRTRTELITVTMPQVSWTPNLTRTKSLGFTETPIYIPPPTPPPTPMPTPVPPNLAAPPEEANYAFVVGPSVAFVVIAVAVALAVIAKKKRSAKKAEEARFRLERGDVPEEMNHNEEMSDRGRGRGDDDYEPPVLSEDLDARE
ncbi:membrane-associated protein, putative [Bodo saltans]|uniref:Membrane-associated protein, putative n=1 Tax=Bodo saltans TaxID=75058 RepID=A0A0S4JC87_BODSA|nr:membrane-associated protein, putative [Bodo saltans]|eukprot:CUG87804.1 membrane-associated protein, putative [Bodo saltans]